VSSGAVILSPYLKMRLRRRLRSKDPRSHAPRVATFTPVICLFDPPRPARFTASCRSVADIMPALREEDRRFGRYHVATPYTARQANIRNVLP